MSEEDVFSGYGVEVILENPDDFLKVKETLTRIGIASKKNKTLYQSCHILHKRNRYAILHFKELFGLDGKESTLTETDVEKRNAISKLLSDWGLVKIVDPKQIESTDVKMAISQIKVIPFKEKTQWDLLPKYTIGNVRRRNHYSEAA
jgi:hypothetical protein